MKKHLKIKIFFSSLALILFLSAGSILASNEGENENESGSSDSSDYSESNRQSIEFSSIQENSVESENSSFEHNSTSAYDDSPDSAGDDSTDGNRNNNSRSAVIYYESDSFGVRDNSQDDNGLERETEHGLTYLKASGSEPSPDKNLENAVEGKILIQTQSHGEAWYVEPDKNRVVYLGRPDDALRVMKQFGLGISNHDLEKIRESGNENNDQSMFSDKLAKRLSGKILLQVENHGEAWYVNPNTLERHYLGRPADALNLMRNLGLGITNENLAKLAKK